ncbi:hypothetical protein MIC448_2680005 [Microbacterium sp. C448]|nr:hypothetical protein MIC448_2680005 [Microbacterium sp. C448]
MTPDRPTIDTKSRLDNPQELSNLRRDMVTLRVSISLLAVACRMETIPSPRLSAPPRATSREMR